MKDIEVSKRKIDLEILDRLTNKSKLTKKDVDKIASKINKEVAKELFGTLKLKKPTQKAMKEIDKGYD